MKPFQQHRPFVFLIAIASLGGLGALACSRPASAPESAAASDPGAQQPAAPAGMPAEPAAPGVDPVAPSSDPTGSAETPAASDAPLDNSRGATGIGSDLAAGRARAA